MIYYLMTEHSFSHLHSLTEDETWIFLEGDPILQTTLSPEGAVSHTVLDADNRISVVKKDFFQATRLAAVKQGYALVSTVMSPRYRDDMYTHGASVPKFRTMKELEDLL
jgi:predicted cupin superfamily sugar epimerase